MLDFKFDKKLISTEELITQLGLSLGWLDLQKSKWRDRKYKEFLTQGGAGTYKDFKKNNDPCWDMGLRLIGTKAFWDPIAFTKWLFEYQCKNKPTNLMEREDNKKLIAFITRNTKINEE